MILSDIVETSNDFFTPHLDAVMACMLQIAALPNYEDDILLKHFRQ
jgi:hypothetical protein